MLRNELENLSISRYDFGKNIYRESVSLRQKILLDPLHTSLRIQDYDDPDNDIYIGAFLGERFIGTVTLTKEPERIKMRQFAVEDAFQDAGVGSELLKHAEMTAAKLGYKDIYLHAREYVVPFYARHGYEKVGKRLIEISLPHWEMRKTLSM